MAPRNILLLATAILLPGCDEFRYEITMRRTADGAVLREVRYSVHASGSVASKEAGAAGHLEEIYGASSANTATLHIFSKSFRDALPADLKIGTVANFGTMASSASPLGAVHVYRERMPGLTRPWRMIVAVEKMIDTAISAWLAYAAQTPELRGDPEKLQVLEALLRGPVREDALDLAVMCWQEYVAVGRAEKDPDRATVMMQTLSERMTLFLQERLYISSSEGTHRHEALLAKSAFHGVLRRIHVELGGAFGDPLPPALEGLLTEDGMENAFNQGLCQLGLTQNDISQLASEVFDTGAGGDTLTATIRWAGEPQPSATNGTWDGASGELSWTSGAAGPPLLPDVLFAIWVLPDEAAQRKFFGPVVLRERLPEYNEWYRALSPAARAEWDAYLAGFAADADPKKRLRTWILDHEQTVVPVPPEIDSQHGATILLEGLAKALPD